jgi:hypothetical protein
MKTDELLEDLGAAGAPRAGKEPPPPTPPSKKGDAGTSVPTGGNTPSGVPSPPRNDG